MSVSVTPPLQFLLHESNEIECAYPHHRDWRQLPFVLIEQIANGTYLIDREGKPTAACKDGAAFVMPPKMRHRLTVPRGVTCVARWIHADFTMDAHTGLDLFSCLTEPLMVPVSVGQQVGGLIEDLRTVWDPSPHPELPALVRQTELLARMAALLLDNCPALAERASELTRRRVAPVLAYIRENLHRNLTRADLARAARLSPTRFHYVFEAEMGQAPMEYVRALRLKVAKQLLSQSDLSITEIAEKTGFQDAFYFSRLFKRTQGQTPTAYREEMKR